MGEKGEGSGGEGGGKWGRRGREVGGKGEGTGNGVPPCPPPLYYLHVSSDMGFPMWYMRPAKPQISLRI